MPIVVFVLFVVGFWAAGLYIQNISVADQFEDLDADYGTRAALIGAVGGYALAAAACFGMWLVGLLGVFDRIPRTTVLLWVASVLIVGATVFASLFIGSSTAAESVDKSLATQTRRSR